MAAATTATALARLSAGLPGRAAMASRFAGQPETSQCHSDKAEAEMFEGLPPGCGLGQTFRQLIEFVAHSFAFFSWEWLRRYDAGSGRKFPRVRFTVAHFGYIGKASVRKNLRAPKNPIIRDTSPTMRNRPLGCNCFWCDLWKRATEVPVVVQKP